MDDPVAEIPYVIHHLTQTPPSIQQATVARYYTPQASFTHPFCRTGSNTYSLFLIQRIYRWYKILSPRIALKVHSAALDKQNNVLYVGITQVFAIWAIPFHKSEVSLLTVLHLEHSEKDGKWYISSQNDLYQTDQFIKFVLPWFAFIVPLWQYTASWICVLASYIFAPVTWFEEDVQKDFTRKELPPDWDDGK